MQHNGEFHAFTIINVLMWFQARGYGGKNPLWPVQKWRMKKIFNSTKKKNTWFIYLFNFTIHHNVPQLTFKSLCLLKCRPCLATSIARGYIYIDISWNKCIGHTFVMRRMRRNDGIKQEQIRIRLVLTQTNCSALLQ